jgi:hypothetical protein
LEKIKPIKFEQRAWVAQDKSSPEFVTSIFVVHLWSGLGFLGNVRTIPKISSTGGIIVSMKT